MKAISANLTRAICVCLVLALLIVTMGIAPIQVNAAAFPFTDVPADHEYREAIEYVYEAGLMNGLSDTQFAPDTNLNRAMVITILHRLSGHPANLAPSFPDVSPSAWYYYAVGWGEHYGIITGYDDGKFYPNLTIKVEQAVTFLYRYSTEYKDYTYNLISANYASGKSDYSSITAYARTPVNWALNCGVLDFTQTTCTPRANVTRGLFCQYLYEYLTHVLGDGMAFVSREFSQYRLYADSNTPQIANHMAQLGYDATWGYDVHPRELNFAMRNAKVVLTLSHGSTENLYLRNHITLGKSDITAGCLSDSELIVVCACYAGNELAKHMYEVGGAGAVIGFKGQVGFTRPNNGINDFNRILFDLLSEGYSLSDAVELAKSQTEVKNPQMETGVDTVIVYGDYQ